jgi:hypothetical protein
MLEVGIAAVEAVFDWKRYLSDAFGITVTEENTITAEPPVEEDLQ